MNAVSSQTPTSLKDIEPNNSIFHQFQLPATLVHWAHSTVMSWLDRKYVPAIPADLYVDFHKKIVESAVRKIKISCHFAIAICSYKQLNI